MKANIYNFKKHISISIFSIFLILAISSCNKADKAETPDQIDNQGTQSECSPELFLKAMEEKTDFYLNGKNSPITDSIKSLGFSFTFFDYNSDYCIKARLIQPLDNDTVDMPDTGGKIRKMPLAGRLRFALMGKVFMLPAYFQGDNNSSIFFPFKDLSNGTTTYQAGRYLDLDVSGVDLSLDSIKLDFNYAYNPYCAYNESYSCPIVPITNVIGIEINAGEKYTSTKK